MLSALLYAFLGWVGTFPRTACSAGLAGVWGSDLYGQRHVPAGLTNLQKVVAGSHHLLAIRADATVAAWGDNQAGQTNVPAGLSNVVDIAAGGYHSLALRADGTLVMWGNFGLGQGALPSGLSNVTAIAACMDHSLVMRADGTLVAWGANGYGEGAVPAGLSNVTAIAAGYYHNLAIRQDGSVVAWGNNSFLQTNVPAGIEPVIAVAGGGRHSLALTDEGRVVAWGDNSLGQTIVPPEATNVVAIAAGVFHSIALRADGTLVGWGANAFGETNPPSIVRGATAISCGEYYSAGLMSSGPAQINAQPLSVVVPYGSNAVFEVGTIFAPEASYQWFHNCYALTNSDRISGADTARLVISGAQFGDEGDYFAEVSNPLAVVLSSAAALEVLGPPVIDVPLGNITTPAGASLNLAAGASGTPPLKYQWLLDGTNIPGATAGSLFLSNVQAAQSGLYSVTVSNDYGGAINNGQLTVTAEAPYPFNPVVTRQTLGGSNLVPVRGSATLHVQVHGSVPLYYQWYLDGVELPGQTNDNLAFDNMTFDQSGYYSARVTNALGSVLSQKSLLTVVQPFVWSSRAPIPDSVPPSLTNVVEVALGQNHLLTRQTDGSIAFWPLNPYFNHLLTNVPFGLTGVSTIAAGSSFNLLGMANGTVQGWGYPVGLQIPANLRDVSQVAAGLNHGLALQKAGTVVAWGINTAGQTNVPPGLSNITAVAGGAYHTMALRADGSVTVWGTATNQPGLSNVIAVAAGGQNCLALLENGSVVGWNSPYAPPPTGLSNVVALAAGSDHNLALRADGTVASWGQSADPVASQLSNIVAVAAGQDYRVAVVGDGSPFVTLQPHDEVAERHAAGAFHARVVGVQPMTYQWQFQGQDIPGATSASLLLTNLGGVNIGSYALTARNILGTVVTDPAQLTISYRGTLGDALNAPDFIWMSYYPWRPWFGELAISHDGDAAAQSPLIGDNEFSILMTSVMGPGTLSFWWKVSSEEGYDFLKFGIDTPDTLSISGEVDWRYVEVLVPAGSHWLMWSYEKDPSFSRGLDAGWVDQVTFSPLQPQIVTQPLDQTVWAGTNVSFEVAAAGVVPLRYQWFRNGVALPAATVSTLTLTNVSRHDAAAYFVVVSNLAGSTSSSNALLKVLVAQNLTAPTMRADGTFIFFSGDADGSPLFESDLRNFEAQASTNLFDWVSLPDALTVTNGVLQVRDPAATGLGIRFYRLLENRP